MLHDWLMFSLSLYPCGKYPKLKNQKSCGRIPVLKFISYLMWVSQLTWVYCIFSERRLVIPTSQRLRSQGRDRWNLGDGHLLSTYYVPGTVLNIFSIVSISFNIPNNFMRWGLFSSPFYNQENWDRVEVKSFAKGLRASQVQDSNLVVQRLDPQVYSLCHTEKVLCVIYID